MTKQETENIMKCKMDNFDYIKLKIFCTDKANAIKIRKEAKTGKEFLQLVSVIKVSFLKYIENGVKFTRIRVIPQLINGQRMNRHFSKEEIKAIVI